FRFLWRHRFIRTTAILYGLGNFILPGVFLIVIVVGRRQGLSGGEIGGLFAIFGAVLLLGSLPRRSCAAPSRRERSSCSRSGPVWESRHSSRGRASTFSWQRSFRRH